MKEEDVFDDEEILLPEDKEPINIFDVELDKIEELNETYDKKFLGKHIRITESPVNNIMGLTGKAGIVTERDDNFGYYQIEVLFDEQEIKKFPDVLKYTSNDRKDVKEGETKVIASVRIDEINLISEDEYNTEVFCNKL